MMSQKPSLSLYFVALIAAMFMVISIAQPANSKLIRKSCEHRDTYFSNYHEEIPGLKVLDALRAQRKYIDEANVS